MVHQLSLVSSIPHSTYAQTVLTLQALTGLLLPQPVATYTLLAKPHDVFKPKFEPGKVNQIEQYYMRCTTTWDDDSSNIDIGSPVFKDASAIFVDRLFVDGTKKNWTLQIPDIPNAGKTQETLAQNIYESTVVHHHTKVVGVETVQVEANSKDEGDKTTHNAPKNQKTDENGPPNVNDGDKTAQDVKREEKTPQNGKIDEKDPATGSKEAETAPDAMDLDAPNDFDDLFDVKDEPMEVEPTEIPTEDKKPDVPSADIKELENGQDTAQEHQREAEFTQVEVTTRKDSFLQFLEDLGYDLVNQYWIKGIRFFHGDIVIEIFKIFIRDDSKNSADGKLKLKLLDESNTFQIKAFINFPKSTDVESINNGTKSLLRLQGFLKNLFQLEIPDRMFMDSRVTASE